MTSNLDIFDRKRQSGRIDIERIGNVFDAKSRGVRAFTLLLSTDAIDFSQPVTLTVNGVQAFQGRLTKDPAVLMKWAARYADRVAIMEQGRITALGLTDETLDPARLSAVFATPIVRVDADGTPAFLSLGR